MVFENITSKKIDGYTYKWNGSTFSSFFTYKAVLSHDGSKRARNPNIATTRNKARFAVVWHEEGLVDPPVTLNVTYSTTPPVTYSSQISLLQSKVYIYSSDRAPYAADLLGSNTAIANLPGKEVIRTGPATTFHLFDRNYNPDVSFSEEPINSNSGAQNVISVVFLSQWFDPSNFSIVSGQLAVVQGTDQEFANTTGTSVLTTTANFTTLYQGKPRIAARLSQLVPATYTAKDFSVVMGNSATPLPPCGGTGTLSSKLHNWWFQTGGAACPSGGVDLLAGTSFASVTTVDPVISCVNGRGHYNVVFSTMSAANELNVVANTYKEGAVVLPGSASRVNYGACGPTVAGHQVLPSVASVRKTSSANTANAHSNYLFWDQQNRSLNSKQLTTSIAPGGNAQLRQAQDNDPKQMDVKFMAYPNPADHDILFDFKLGYDETPKEIEIFNMTGQSVDKFSVSSDVIEQRRDVSKLPSGTYISVLKTNVKDYSLQIVKE